MPETVATGEITAAALDYVEGWFDGDADRMRRALHPDLVKRRLRADGVDGRAHRDADRRPDGRLDGGR